MAELLGISDRLDRWQAISASQGRESAEARLLQHSLMDRLVSASFSVDRVIAELQSEESHCQDAMNELEAMSGDRVGKLNLYAGILGGFATLGTALTLKNNTNEGGIWVTVIAGGGAAVLTSIAATTQPSGPAGIPIPYSMLGPILQDRVDPRYQPLVWRYLHSQSPTDPVSPRTRLLQEWKRLGWLEPEDLATLPNALRPTTDVSLDMLSQRLRMLADVRSEVARMKAEISNLAERLVPPPPAGAEGAAPSALPR